MELAERLTEIFREDFGDHTEFRVEPMSRGRVAGTVISGSFTEKTEVERQETIWKTLDRHLSEDEKQRIVLLIPNTPEEEEAFDEERREESETRIRWEGQQ